MEQRYKETGSESMKQEYESFMQILSLIHILGQGDGLVLRTPEGNCFLVDGGSTNKSGVGQYQVLPYLKNQGISQIDGIFISHTDQDHILSLIHI